MPSLRICVMLLQGIFSIVGVAFGIGVLTFSDDKASAAVFLALGALSRIEFVDDWNKYKRGELV